ncbi:MAG: hypothetical protein L3J12_03160 [Spirochaetales bacterium]|nr:hypothetical protein [Spirochaetales bacterium]
MDIEKAIGDLELINNVMASCARKQEDYGVYFKIWGLLIPVAAVLNYLLVYAGKSSLVWFSWAAAMIFGILLSISISRKRKEGNADSTGAKLLTALWGSSWISIAVLMSVGMISRVLTLNGVMFTIPLIMAGSFFISGVLGGSSMLKVVAAGWWVSGVINAFLPPFWAPVFLAGSTFFLSFIPGLLLDRRYRIKKMLKTNES